MTDDPLVIDERLLGAIPSPTDPRDLQIGPLLDTAAKLPRRYLAPLMPPVLNQGNTGRCVAFASTGVKAWEERQAGHGFLNLDADALYLAAGGSQDRQRGLTCRSALSVLLHEGEPLIGAPDSASRFKIGAYYAVPFTVDALKRALVQFGPLLVASLWYRSWFRPIKGVMPAPAGGIVGGHAEVLFGWDDDVNDGSLLIRNSWRRSWGVNGNHYAAYRWFLPALHDAWKVRDAKEDPHA